VLVVQVETYLMVQMEATLFFLLLQQLAVVVAVQAEQRQTLVLA
jgi:hypothetical protein